MKINSLTRPGSLVDHVVEQIRNNIESGALKSADRLPTECELGRRFGVSRTVIREASRRLQSLGLVEVRRGSGVFVGDHDSVRDTAAMLRSSISLSISDLETFIGFRTALEVHAARKAAEKATDDDVKRLQELCDKLLAGVEKEAVFREVQECDVALHLEIARIAGNSLISQILQLVREMMLRSMARSAPLGVVMDKKSSRALHQGIVDAIKIHDPDAAGKVMEEHMKIAFATLQAAGAGTKLS